MQDFHQPTKEVQMSTATVAYRASVHRVPSSTNGAGSTADRIKDDPAYQAFWLLRIGFGGASPGVP